jgi:hypothetical protein
VRPSLISGCESSVAPLTTHTNLVLSEGVALGLPALSRGASPRPVLIRGASPLQLTALSPASPRAVRVARVAALAVVSQLPSTVGVAADAARDASDGGGLTDRVWDIWGS